MGLPDSYQLPANYNEGYHLTGDGVAVPVVSYLTKKLFEKILFASMLDKMDAA
jgi:DNA (cytosine-5)-methyltransferase 1